MALDEERFEPKTLPSASTLEGTAGEMRNEECTWMLVRPAHVSGDILDARAVDCA